MGFFDNGLKQSQQGKHQCLLVLSNDNLWKEACEWVRDNAFKKEQPNMTAASFCEYVNSIFYQVTTYHHISHIPYCFELLFDSYID